jgi:F0F1-type ATP synthase assembly protein I
MKSEEPKFKKVAQGAEQLSLGVSVVVAILLGVGIGILMRDSLGYDWLLWLGIFWGVAAAGLNIYKAYKKQMKELEEYKDDVRYKKYQKNDEE